jgi:hypothetical protein
LRTQLRLLPTWGERFNLIERQLDQYTQALDARQEKLEALRPDFAQLTNAFWRAFEIRLRERAYPDLKALGSLVLITAARATI